MRVQSTIFGCNEASGLHGVIDYFLVTIKVYVVAYFD